MGFFKDLVDKVQKKKDDLEEEAKKRAAKKAAEMALEGSKAAARSAVKNAGKTLDYAGKKLEEAIFGADESEDSGDARARARARDGEEEGGTSDPPDPFAALKAREAARKEREKASKVAEDRANKDRAEARARADREVEDELAALKKKIRGG